MSHRLRFHFDNASSFDAEFHKNISKGGASFATTGAPELRTIVEVELDLAFRDEQRVFEAEIVHVVPGVMVAVQFLKPAEELREELEEFLTSEGAPVAEPDAPPATAESAAVEVPELETDEDEPDDFDILPPPSIDDELDHQAAEARGIAKPSLVDGEPDGPQLAVLDEGGRGGPLAQTGGLETVDAEPTPEPVWADQPDQNGSDDPLWHVDDRRRSPRATVRMPVRLDTTNFSLDGHTRDLSESGVLISADGNELPLGKSIQLELQHPETGERVELSGTVSRHIEGEGTVAAVGVDFEPAPGKERHLRKFVGEAKRIEAIRAAAGITGRIEELGMPNLMQMLCASSPSGTLTAERGAEEAVFAFEDGMIRYVRLGALRGVKALARMFGWAEGTFSFHSHVDALTDEDDPIPLTNAILEAARQVDEAARPGLKRFEPSTRFLVDLDAARSVELTQIEHAVLELAMPGLTLRRILDVIPETDATVLEAIQSMVERRVLTAQTN